MTKGREERKTREEKLMVAIGDRRDLRTHKDTEKERKEIELRGRRGQQRKRMFWRNCSDVKKEHFPPSLPPYMYSPPQHHCYSPRTHQHIVHTLKCQSITGSARRSLCSSYLPCQSRQFVFFSALKQQIKRPTLRDY